MAAQPPCLPRPFSLTARTHRSYLFVIVSLLCCACVLSAGWLAHAGSAKAAHPAAPLLARLDERVSVRGVGRGNPSLTISDGHELLTSYAGAAALQQAL